MSTSALRLPEDISGPWVLPTMAISLAVGAFSGQFSTAADFIGWAALLALAALAVYHIVARVTQRAVPRRFANLVYVLDSELNLAVVKHPHHKRWIPPGSRLGYHEAPHDAVGRVLEDELGLGAKSASFWPSTGDMAYGSTTLVPTPFQVQVERRKQRLGVGEHYDFVYVCTVPGRKPNLDSPLSPRWVSPADLEQLREEEATFPDVMPTYRHIVAEMSTKP